MSTPLSGQDGQMLIRAKNLWPTSAGMNETVTGAVGGNGKNASESTVNELMFVC